ncbi:hypothetical protein H8959_018956 [Pygathrix nigripes]
MAERVAPASLRRARLALPVTASVPRPGARVRLGSAAAWPDGASAEGRNQGARGQRSGRAPEPEQVTYGSFDYTSLLYLSDYLEDFGGGRFVFMEEGANKTVEPRADPLKAVGVGVALWSLLCLLLSQAASPSSPQGSENLHRVEKVHWGTRYAITIAFSCNPDHGIEDPAFP